MINLNPENNLATNLATGNNKYKEFFSWCYPSIKFSKISEEDILIDKTADFSFYSSCCEPFISLVDNKNGQCIGAWEFENNPLEILDYLKSKLHLIK